MSVILLFLIQFNNSMHISDETKRQTTQKKQKQKLKI